MYNVAKIQTALNGVVGFKQPDNPTYQILDAANQASRSGRFVTDNPYVKIEYLHSNQDYAELSDSEFNTNLQTIQKNAISEVAGWVFNESDYIDRQVLYKNAHNRINTVTLPSGLACYKINVADNKNIAFEITRVFLDFEGAGDLRILLFSSEKPDAPIFFEDVTIANEPNKEVQLNWVVDNSDGFYKGEFYLGFLTNDPGLGTLKPYDRDYENSDIMSEITHLSTRRQLFPGVTTEELPNLESDDGLSDNLGINPDITVYDDYTDLITNNEKLFQYGIYLQVSIKCMEVYLSSLRSNREQREAERVILRVTQQLEGQRGEGVVFIRGLRPALTTELARIQEEIEKIRGNYFPSTGLVVHTLQ